MSSVIARLKSIGRNLKRELKVYRLVCKDRRTPKLAKFLLGLAVVYVLLPFDIIPDFIPLVGQLDDLIMIPLLVILALKLTPKEVLEDCRARASQS